jgi:DNA replication initiation complex subunit (GINS family)
MIQPSMQELLQQIDLDYYRSVRLLIVHAELEKLRQQRPASDDLERRRGPRIDEVAKDVGLTTRCAARPAE